ncbi:DNA primase [Candidatus Saccharibacteria bacterium]|nr:DNA primase [Candidatus Saccharibacteria bacterium]
MDAVAEVKARLSIEDVIGEYVQLKRAGRNLKGLSPFGNEKTASFMVSPEKQIWHDFSSGKGGDMFSFIQEVEGLDFKETLELLARKAGVDLEQFKGQSKGNSKEKERLYEVLELASRFYQTQLRNSRQALEYLLKKRAFSKETVLLFKLGYSPNTGDALYTFLKSKGFSEPEMTRAGLVTKRYRGPGDMFRGRIMVPLSDAQGRVVGFTARLLLDDPDAPKYINTPSTLLYDKGRQVYGLHLAKDAIRKIGFGVVVEGNLDVIASHQAGVQNVVAAAGTALTESHLKDLSRFAGDIRFAFDSDRAGINATERAIPLAQKVGVNVSIIDIPGGKDPDELVRKDPKLWQNAIDKHQYAVDWLIDRYSKLLDTTTGKGKREFIDAILGVIRNLTNSVEQDHYIDVLAKKIDVSRAAVSAKLHEKPKSLVRLKKAAKTPEQESKSLIDQRKAEQHLVALMLMQPSIREHVKLATADMFTLDSARELFTFIKEHPDFAGDSNALKPLQSIADYVKITILQFDELYRTLETIELQYEAARLQERLVTQYVKQQKKVTSEQLAEADDATAHKLLEQDKILNNLLNQVKRS